MKRNMLWILALPVALATTAFAWVLLAFFSNLNDAVNIVSQSDTISVAMANFGINSISAGLGIVAGAAIAPGSRSKVAFGLGLLYVVLAAATMAYGITMRDRLNISLGWHAWSTVAWVVGTVFGTLVAMNSSGRKQTRTQ